MNSFIRQNGCKSLIEKQYRHVDKMVKDVTSIYPLTNGGMKKMN